MEEKQKCPLCNFQCKIDCNNPSDLNKWFTINCSICGIYKLEDGAISILNKRKDYLYIISGVTRKYFEHSTFLIISKSILSDDSKFQAEFLSKTPKSVSEKASLLLQYIARKSKHPGDEIIVNSLIDYPICFCKNHQELTFYIKHLIQIEFISQKSETNANYHLFITASGWQEIDNLTKRNHESKQAFIAMWFDESMDEIFTNGILSLEEETGFKMLRIDQKHFNDKICDHIIAEIKQSRFMIADCTKTSPAVFFEAGYAMGMGLPVIFTCKEGTNIKECFDTDHYNHIVWKDAEDLKNKLKDRILATITKA